MTKVIQIQKVVQLCAPDYGGLYAVTEGGEIYWRSSIAQKPEWVKIEDIEKIIETE